MKKIYVLFIFLLASISAISQSFNASVSRNPVGEGDSFQVTFSLENAQGSSFQSPGFKGFSVLTGPSRSHSTQIVNGNMSSSASYTYLLKADKTGSFTIGSASITVDGKRLRTKPIQVKVVKGSPKQKNEDSDQTATIGEQAYNLISKNMFLKLNVSKTNVYENEQLVATYKLYVHPELNLVDISAPKMPTFNGFWTHDLDIGQLRFSSERYNGTTYKVANLKKVVLLPQQTGKLKLDPMEVEFVVRLRMQNQRRNRDPFSFFDNSNYKDFPYTAKARSVTINVKSLPEAAPTDFNGAVGNLKMKVWLDKRNTKTNEPITLKIQLSGKGNLKLIQPLALNLPNDLESYEPKINDNISITSSGMSGSRTFEYLLLPRNPGKFRIDPVNFTYFDLVSKKYKTLSSEEFEINVEKGSGSASSPLITGVRKEDVQLLGKDIRFIKTAPESFSKNGKKFYCSLCFIMINITPALLLVFFFAYRKKQDKLTGNIALMKRKKANKLVKKRLASAKAYMNKDENKFYEEISHALWGYVSDKLSIPYSDLTSQSAEEKLQGINIPEDILQKVMETIDYCESARFSPNSEKLNQIDLYNDAASVITNMENVIK